MSSRILEAVDEALRDLRSARTSNEPLKINALEAAYITLANPNAHWIPRRRAERTIAEHLKRRERERKRAKAKRKRKLKRAQKMRMYWSCAHYYQRYAEWLFRHRGERVALSLTEYTAIVKWKDADRSRRTIRFRRIDPTKPWMWDNIILWKSLNHRFPEEYVLTDILEQPSNWRECKRSWERILPYFHERWYDGKEGEVYVPPDKQETL